MEMKDRIKEIKDRIKLIMEKENMIAGVFADSIGVKQSTLSHIINGRNSPSLDVTMRILQRYKYINFEWLLYGTGQMINENFPSSEIPSSLTLNSDPKHPTLFDQNPEKSPVEPEDSKNRQEMALEIPILDTKASVIQEIKYVEKPLRKITEIRIFFDDNTYETFRGDK